MSDQDNACAEAIGQVAHCAMPFELVPYKYESSPVALIVNIKTFQPDLRSEGLFCRRLCSTAILSMLCIKHAAAHAKALSIHSLTLI